MNMLMKKVVLSRVKKGHYVAKHDPEISVRRSGDNRRAYYQWTVYLGSRIVDHQVYDLDRARRVIRNIGPCAECGQTLPSELTYGCCPKCAHQRDRDREAYERGRKAVALVEHAYELAARIQAADTQEKALALAAELGTVFASDQAQLKKDLGV